MVHKVFEKLKCPLPEKTADIWRRYHWFPCQMTSQAASHEKQGHKNVFSAKHALSENSTDLKRKDGLLAV